MRVLGIDPGQQTGLAWIEESPGGTFSLLGAQTVALDALIPVCVLSPAHSAVDLVVVEDWEYQGPKRARGVPHQAFAVGYVCGVLAANGRTPLRVTRTVVLSALGIPRAGKARVAAFARRLVTPATPELMASERTEHEWDAVAVAIAGLGMYARQMLAGIG